MSSFHAFLDDMDRDGHFYDRPQVPTPKTWKVALALMVLAISLYILSL